MPRLLLVALAFGAFTLMATGVAIAERLPYRFGGTGDPDRVAADAFLHGTGVSAPLVFMVVIIVLAWVAGRRNWIGIGARPRSWRSSAWSASSLGSWSRRFAPSIRS